jgi:hypothetical protein
MTDNGHTNSTSLDLAMVKEFAELYAEEERLKEELEAVKKKRDVIMEPLMQALLLTGTQSVPILAKGRKYTVHLHKSIWAKAKGGDKDRVMRALKLSGMEYSGIVAEGYNSNTLSGLVRESLAQGREIPREIAAVIDIDERVELRARSNSMEPSKAELASKTLRKMQKAEERNQES